MIRDFSSGRGLALALILGACGQSAPDEPATRADFSADLVRRASDAPADGPSDACWANDEMPAIIETVTEQVLVTPEMRSPDGTITEAAIFTTKVDQRMVQEREVVWFQTPCAAQIDGAFLASLQRALKARGYYLHDLTGEMDPATRIAIRRFQSERGLDSETLSLAAARDLGLIEVPRNQL
jgi:Putative peptidoglycan binding domain